MADPSDPPATAPSLGRWRLLAYLLPGLVLALSLAVSWFVREGAIRDIERAAEIDFEAHVREITGIFRERIQAYERALHATSGLFAASRSVEPDEFTAFVGSLQIDRLAGLQGLGFIRALPQSGGGPAAEIRYFEPKAARTLAVPGTNPLAEPSRRPAMEAARDAAGIAIANKKKLPEEDEATLQAGLRMYLPVYRNGSRHDTVAERRANLAGWVYAAFDVSAMVADLRGRYADIALEIHDGADTLEDARALDSRQDRVGGESPLKLLAVERPVVIGGYAWTLSARALPAFTPLAAGNVRLVTGEGLGASALLAILTWLAMRRRLRSLRGNEELRAAKSRAEEANRAKSRFLAAASHDLRQPTHALGLFIAALHALAKRPDIKGADVEHIATRLQTALNGLGNLLNGILDISRLDAGAVEVRTCPAALIDELASLYDAFSGPAKAKGLELRIVPSSLWTDTDPVLLHRILSNLVSNAVRYTKRGRVLVGCRRRRGKIEIQVWDTGIGIAKDQLANIFAEFYQVGNVVRDREQGLGLGLAIAQRSAELLGSRLRVRSTPGKGSLFAIALPCSDGPPAATAPSPQRGRHESITVLAIDDDREVLDALETLLSTWGHVVVPAESVVEAVTAAARSPAIGLILADYRLAGDSTGVDAIRAVFARLDRAIPAVIITGDTSPERIREAEASGFAVMHKPLDPQELRELLASCA